MIISRSTCAVERGATLLELIAAACIAVPMLAAFLTLFRGTSAAFSGMLRRRAEIVQELTIFAHLQNVQDQMDAHPFPLLPRIHKDGRITYTDGSVNRVSTNARLKPHPGSSAITYAALDLKAAHKVVRSPRKLPADSIYACPRHNHPIDAALYNSYLGIGVDGFLELTGTSSISGSCRTFRLRPGKSMIAPATISSLDLTHVMALVPMRSVHTLYLDSERTLRFLSHSGIANIENQPLGAHYPALDFKLVALPRTQIYAIEAQLAFNGGRRAELSVVQRIERRPAFNYLFNAL